MQHRDFHEHLTSRREAPSAYLLKARKMSGSLWLYCCKNLQAAQRQNCYQFIIWKLNVKDYSFLIHSTVSESFSTTHFNMLCIWSFIMFFFVYLLLLLPLNWTAFKKRYDHLGDIFDHNINKSRSLSPGQSTELYLQVY